MKAIILQEKGGVGKSYFSKMLYLYFLSIQEKFRLIDCDNASGSLSKFAVNVKPLVGNGLLTAEAVDFLNESQKIDRSKFDIFLEDILVAKEHCVIDFGAATSEQFLYYLQENAGIIEDLNKLGLTLFVVVSGDSSWQDCFSYLKKIDKAGLMPIVKVVANEQLGGVGEKSVSMLLKEMDINPITIDRIGDQGDNASQEWQDLLINGLSVETIEGLPLLRRRRVNNYLNGIFEQIKAYKQ